MRSPVKVNEAHSHIVPILSNLSKLAIDSTFNDSLKGLAGPGKLYKIVQERLKHPPASLPVHNCKKPEDARLAEEMRVKVEEMLDEMVRLKQQDEVSANFLEEQQAVAPLRKGPNEGSKKLGVLEPEKKRSFIRSRL